MPIISDIEKRTPKGRGLFAILYLLLAFGGISTVYPFLLMVRLSTADAVDQRRLEPFPSFWWNRDDLAKKYLLKRYSDANAKVSVPVIAAPLGPEWTSANFADLKEFWRTYYQPFDRIPVEAQRRQILDYRSFLSSLKPTSYTVADWDCDPDFLNYDDYLDKRLHLSTGERAIQYRVKVDTSIRGWHPHPDASYHLTWKYLAWTKPAYRHALAPAWVGYLKSKYGQFEVTKLNSAYGTHYTSWTELSFPLEAPINSVERNDYNDYVKKQFPYIWTRIKGDYQHEWTNFLVVEKKIVKPSAWKALTGIQTDSILAVPFLPELPDNEAWATVWSEFVFEKVHISDRKLLSPDRLYVQYLQSRYGSLENLNRAWATSLANWGDVRFADALSDYRSMMDRTTAIKTALTTDPYRVAIKILGRQSGAITNTLILMALALTAALTVNPLAAYALSRFRIKGTHKILLFILATMALPGEIAMVPSFLLVKNLGLMNNYLAIILPGAASAFGIFLLKGFFDSLPQELYEAATIDGAPELTMFTRITIPLSKPILAVTAMGAVLGAYGVFIPAILYLQNSDMWPLMPRIYELSTRGGSEATYAVNMAALVISSIPTLLVFLFAQRMIMRGIILPTMK
jgi:ABC-type glycerol-3-phosphate transport system permease component